MTALDALLQLRVHVHRHLRVGVPDLAHQPLHVEVVGEQGRRSAAVRLATGKKHRGSSSTLSHLFTQGLNSAERLRMDDHFRSEARKIVATADPSFAAVIGVPVDPTAHTIIFGVITRSTRPTPMTLPFFSVVSLRAAAQRLQGMGFQVARATIPQA